MEKPAVYSIMRVHLIERLAELYKTDSLAAAKICDEVLDRSGALLGEVRIYHRAKENKYTLTIHVEANSPAEVNELGKTLVSSIECITDFEHSTNNELIEE